MIKINLSLPIFVCAGKPVVVYAVLNADSCPSGTAHVSTGTHQDTMSAAATPLSPAVEVAAGKTAVSDAIVILATTAEPT
jgi:hypothetical protein